MVAEILDVIDDTKNNVHTNVGKKFTLEELKSVWNHFSEQVSKNLQNRKCIIMKGIGVFTLRDWSLETGIRQKLNHYEPAFLLSRDLLERFYLYQRKQYFSDSIPVTPLNFIEAAEECKLTKEITSFCYNEIVHCLRRLIADEKDLVLKMPGLGELQIIKNRVTYTFHSTIKQIKKEPEIICYKYKAAIQPFYPKKIYPCEIHTQPIV